MNVVSKKVGGDKNIIKFLRDRHVFKNWQLYLMLIPVVFYFATFCYRPMYGILLAFKDYKARMGITRSPWVDPLFTYFIRFFSSPYFVRVVSNTVIISLEALILGFPTPILLALCINEVSNSKYKKFVQNITYAPHFLSTVVLVGLIRSFVNSDFGIVNIAIRAMGGQGQNWLQRINMFRPLYIGSGIWQNAGWSSIIYIAALAGIDPQIHESAMIDGASRLKRIWHINLPGILPTVIILLIMNSGSIMSVGFEKVFLMQNDLNLAASEVISTYAYKIGIESAQYSMSTAIGLFNSVINCALLVVVNMIARRVGETSLW